MAQQASNWAAQKAVGTAPSSNVPGRMRGEAVPNREWPLSVKHDRPSEGALLASNLDKATKLLGIDGFPALFLEHGSPIQHYGSGMPQHGSAETRSNWKAEC